MYLKQPGFTCTACRPSTKNTERIKKIKETVIEDIFIKTSYVKLVFNIIWLMEVLKI